MKKYIVLFVGIASFMSSSAVLAEQSGVYLAPKLIYGHAITDKLRGSTDYYSYFFDKNERIGNTSSSESDNIFGIGLSIGYDFNKRFEFPVRTELEYNIFSRSNTQNEVSVFEPPYNGTTLNGTHYMETKQKLGIQTLFVNAYYDINTNTVFTPYVGGGVGVAFINVKQSGVDTFSTAPQNNNWASSERDVTNFAWNVGTGIAWNMNKNSTIDLGYRYVNLGKVKGDSAVLYHPPGYIFTYGSQSGKVYMHQIAATLRIAY